MKRLIKAYIYKGYEIQNEFGHYVIYDKNGEFVESCDTSEEAQRDIDKDFED